MSEYRRLITPQTTADVIKALQARVDELERRAARAAAIEGWHGVGTSGEPAFANGWTTSGTDSPRFRRLATTVFVSGTVQSGSLGVAVFTLPAGYRPSQRVRRVIWTWSGSVLNPGIARVQTDGAVLIENSGYTVQQASLDLSFAL